MNSYLWHIIFNYSLILSSSGFSVSDSSTSGLSTSDVDSSGFIFSGFVVLPWLLVSGFCVTVLFVWRVVGVPEITPVWELRVNPVGNVPDIIEKIGESPLYEGVTEKG